MFTVARRRGRVVGGNGVIAPLTISGDPTTATPNQAYSFTPTVTGGSGLQVFYTLLGSLPTGLSFDTTTGIISGTPTDSSFTTRCRIRVTDNSGSAESTRTLFIASA